MIVIMKRTTKIQNKMSGKVFVALIISANKVKVQMIESLATIQVSTRLLKAALSNTIIQTYAV
jgi:hypothetical protein